MTKVVERRLLWNCRESSGLCGRKAHRNCQLLSSIDLTGVAERAWQARVVERASLRPEIPTSACIADSRATSLDASGAASRDKRCTPPHTAARADGRILG